jgi:hypothetical protein
MLPCIYSQRFVLYINVSMESERNILIYSMGQVKCCFYYSSRRSCTKRIRQRSTLHLSAARRRSINPDSSEARYTARSATSSGGRWADAGAESRGPRPFHVCDTFEESFDKGERNVDTTVDAAHLEAYAARGDQGRFHPTYCSFFARKIWVLRVKIGFSYQPYYGSVSFPKMSRF